MPYSAHNVYQIPIPHASDLATAWRCHIYERTTFYHHRYNPDPFVVNGRLLPHGGDILCGTPYVVVHVDRVAETGRHLLFGELLVLLGLKT